MSQEKHFSDEFLNAFVDNQIAAQEKSRAYVEICQNEDLNRQVCELRKLHDLVQLAYREPPAPPERTVPGPNSRQARMRFGVAASILLTLGIVLGGQIRVPATAPPVTVVPAATHQAQRVVRAASFIKPTVSEAASKAGVAGHLANPQPAVVIPASVPARIGNEILDSNTIKVLIHLARDDADQLNQALDDIESTLKHYREIRQSARVEVVVNGKGLELVRIDTSAFAGRIQRLQREYDNLTFAACQNTIDRLAREQGIIVQLLPGVVTIDSGMAEIMRRQNQGWAYLQV